MPPEPPVKRTIAFFDGQNLFHHAKEAFGHKFPNYDPPALAQRVCGSRGWDLIETRFYTGVPDKGDKPFWNHFWTAKMGAMGHKGVVSVSRPLRYRNQAIILADGTTTTALVGQEKGIDVRIALDLIRLVRESRYDVALVFSQDQDLAEAAEEVRSHSIEQHRWIKVACAFPDSPTTANRRGINGTDWIRIDRATYDVCLDRSDYRPKKGT